MTEKRNISKSSVSPTFSKSKRAHVDQNDKATLPATAAATTITHNPPVSNQQDKPNSDKKKSLEITGEELALYDRQIRLWGMEAQGRMRNAHILIIGVTGLSGEVLKNIVLAGVGKVKILDNEKVQSNDIGSIFLLREKDIGKYKSECILPRLNLLNPRVELDSDISSLTTKPSSFFHQFHLVIMTNGTPTEIATVNNHCHSNGVKFWAAQNHGWQSFIFSDLCSHTYTLETKKTTVSGDKVTKEERTDVYTSFEDAIKGNVMGLRKGLSAVKIKRIVHPLFLAFSVIWLFWHQHQRFPQPDKDILVLMDLKKTVLESHKLSLDFLSDKALIALNKAWGRELAVPCAIVGGFLAQEVLKVLARNEVPLNNMFVHDAIEPSGFLMTLEPLQK